MSIRSTTGCHRCKNIRRKCDEKKPECSRCIRRGIECRYDYVESRGQGFKTRTIPGRRPKKKLAQIEQPLVGSTSATLQSTSRSPSYDIFDLDLLEMPPLPLTDVPLLLDTSPYVIDATPFVQPTSAGLLAQPSMLFRNPSQRRSTLDTEEDDSEQSDVEGVKSIIYATPHLSDVVDNSVFKFVLQNYERWLPQVLFDPLRVMRKVTEKVLYQFSLSATSRSRLVLIARLLDTLSKGWCLDEQGMIVLRLLRDGIFRDIIGCSPEYPVSGKAAQQANSALNNVLELVVIQVWAAPLSWTISLFRIASPVFLVACQYPLLPQFFDITLNSNLNLRHFAAIDVILSLVTGRATFCRYHIPWSLELSDQLLERQGNQGTEWMIGIPDQFLLVLAYMSGLRTVALEGTSHGDGVLHVQNNTNHRSVQARKEGLIDPLLVQKLEGDLRRIRILPGESKDPALMITRIVVQECWREVVYIYFYMALCGADAEDPRVQHSLKGYIRLVNGIKPGKNPDAFLFTPMVIAGVSAIKTKHRQILTSRTLGLPGHSKPGTTGNDLVKILENVWNRTAMEGRPACWDDLSVACHVVTGM